MKNNIVSFKKNYYSIIYIVVFILVLIYISFIIYYLNNLIKCDCYEDKDLKYLLYSEYIILFIAFINIIIFYLIINDSIKDLNYLFIIPIISLIVYIYIIYSTINVYKNTNVSCNCSMSIIRYMLYIQAIIGITALISSAINIFQNKGLTNMYSNFKKRYNNNNTFNKVSKILKK